MNEPTVGMLATVAGVALITTIIVEVILRAAAVSGATKDRFGPLLALTVGVVLSVVGGLATGVDPVTAFLTGILGGASAMGTHDTVDSLASG